MNQLVPPIYEIELDIPTWPVVHVYDNVVCSSASVQPVCRDNRIQMQSWVTPVVDKVQRMGHSVSIQSVPITESVKNA